MSSFASSGSSVIRLVLSGQAAVVSGLAATERGVGRLERRVAGYAATANVATKRTWLLDQALFTLRRYAYAGTIALTAMGVGALKMGFDYNSAMQSATTALLPVMHSTRAVRNELYSLFQQAKYNPFQFKDMTLAFRSMFLAMQPLGITAKTVNTTLHSMIDALSATGRTSPSQLNRVAVALQHMAYQGRLTGFTVNQLARDGIPIFGALSKELGITGHQLHNISSLGIPAQVALDAINKYIETTPGFMGAARRQAMTLSGQLATLKDNISQVSGGLTLGAFRGATSGLLPSLNAFFNKLGPIMKRQCGRISIGQIFNVAGKSYPWLKGFLDLIEDTVKAIKVLWVFIKQSVLPALVIMGVVFDRLINPVVSTFIRFLLWIEKHKWIMRILAGYVIFLAQAWLIEKTILVAVAFWKGINKTLDAMLLLTKKNLVFWQNLLNGAYFRELWLQMRLRIATILSTAALWLQNTAVGTAVYEFFALRMAMLYTIVTMLRLRLAAIATWIALTGPVGWIIAGIVALIATLVILYFKWKWFHNLVDRTWHWIKDHWMLLGAILIGPFALVALYLAEHWRGIIDWVKNIIDWVKKALGWIAKLNPLTWIHKGIGWLGKQFTGGGGGNMVGNLSYPMAPLATPGGVIGGTPYNQIGRSTDYGRGQKPQWDLTVHSNVHIDGKKVAESTAKHRQNKVARK